MRAALTVVAAIAIVLLGLWLFMLHLAPSLQLP